MVTRTMRRRVLPGVVLLLACVAVFGLGRIVGREAPPLALAAAYAADEPAARAEQVDVAGMAGGKVMIGDREVLTIGVEAAGFSGYERASIVADRINREVAGGMGPEDIQVGNEGGLLVIRTGGAHLVTVTPDDARLADMSSYELADTWSDNLRVALGGEPADNPAAGNNPGAWHPSEPYSDKIVPILSLLQGTRIGVARVNGPRSRVHLTQGVAQFSIDFANFLEIDVYVPVSTRVPGRTLDRVQGVGVTGVGDIGI
jgi:hypothetical protein